MMHLAAALILTLAGAAALRHGWRGRRAIRAGLHPHCARCDHDLHGLPPTTTRCPECGAALDASGAVAVGAPLPDRERQFGAAVIAILLLGIGVTQWRSIDWPQARVRVAPASWLIADVGRGGPAGSAAAAELARRVQADRYAGRTLEAVARALWPVRLQARPTNRQGSAVPIELVEGPSISVGLMAEPEPPRYVILHRLARYAFSDDEWVTPDYSWQRGGLPHVGRSSFRLSPPPEVQPGPIDLRVVYELRLVRTEGPEVDARSAPPVVSWEHAATLPVTVVPADAQDVTLVIDPALRATVRVSLRPLEISRARQTLRGVHLNRTRVGVDPGWGIEFLRPPVGMAFDVFLREPGGGRELRLGQVTSAPGRHVQHHASTPSEDAKAFEAWSAPTGDLVLRPSPDAARQRHDLLAIWGEEVIIPGVPVVQTVRDAPPADE